ncbi:hypothetical protein GCM10027061_28000 [Nesterenkonia suensis]
MMPVASSAGLATMLMVSGCGQAGVHHTEETVRSIPQEDGSLMVEVDMRLTNAFTAPQRSHWVPKGRGSPGCRSRSLT